MTRPVLLSHRSCLGLCLLLVIGVASLAKSTLADDSIFKKPSAEIQTRWYTPENQSGEQGAGGKSNFGRKGRPFAIVKPGETLVMADIKGSGTVRRIWSTTEPFDNPSVLRSLKFEMFWEGEKKPAVQVPMGDFYGHTFGKMTRFENIFFSCPEARSYNCFIPMPFKTNARIQLTNESETVIRIFYEINCTLGDKHGDDILYFHSSWRRENFTKPREDFTILPTVQGAGRFLGCNLGIRQNPAMSSFWFGEGEYKVFLDGDKQWPTLCGTGTEDFIGTGWGQGRFDNLYQGCQFVSEQGKGTFKDFYGFYRLHVPDPLYFHKDVMVIIQTLGGANTDHLLKDMNANPTQKYMKAGKGDNWFAKQELEGKEPFFVLVEREDDYCATAYWYLDSPTNSLPELAPLEERTVDLPPKN